MVKQDMARLNMLGISELKWIGMDEFNSDDHYIYYHGQEYLKRNGVALTVNKRLKCSTCVQSQNDRINSVHFQGKSFNVMVIQVYAPITNAEEAEVDQFQEDLQDFLELTHTHTHTHTHTDVLFIIGDGNAKIGTQEIPGVTGKFGLGV